MISMVSRFRRRYALSRSRVLWAAGLAVFLVLLITLSGAAGPEREAGEDPRVRVVPGVRVDGGGEANFFPLTIAYDGDSPIRRFGTLGGTVGNPFAPTTIHAIPTVGGASSPQSEYRKEKKTMSAESNVRIHELLDYVKAGRIMDAMREFYAEDVVMEEPAYGKTVGLAANLDREEKFVASVAEFKNFEATKVGVGENVSLYENVMDWTDVDGNEVHVEQVSVAEWRDGKIVHERFYYDTGGG